DGCHGGALAVGAEVAVAMVQADLGAEGALGYVGRDVRLDGGDALADAGRVLVVPGGLDQQPAGVPRAGLGDVSTVALVTGGVLAGGQAEKAHQLARGGEAPEVAERGQQRERGQGRDAAEAAQPADRIAPWLARGDLVELVIERSDLRGDAVQMGEHVLQRRLRERVVEPLAGHPGGVAWRSRWRRTEAMWRLVQPFLPSR